MPLTTAGPLRQTGSALLACVFAGLAMAACGNDAHTANAPLQLLRSALRDANARGSVHEVVSAAISGQTVRLSDDVAAHDGRQEITKSTGVRAHVVVVGGMAYFSGNQAALVNYFGLPASSASKAGSRWVSVPSGSSAYSAVADDVTLSSSLAGLALAGSLTETGASTVNGVPVIGIEGDLALPGSAKGSVAATVYVTRSSTPLPVRAIYSYSNGTSATIVLADWGERVVLRPPTNPIAYSTLQQ